MGEVERHANEPDLRRVGIHPDFWYPIARSQQLRRRWTRPVTFAGERIVLARSQNGKVFALEDRCAHRQFPLSKGVVRGERLVCGYHKWEYSTAGRCVGAPCLPRGEIMPRGVRSYPAREAYGLVWVFPGNPARAEKVPFPELPTWGVPTHKTMVFEREVNSHYSFMHENLMDMSHQFLHRRLMGEITPGILEVRTGEDRVEVDYDFRETGGRQHWGAYLMVRGRAEAEEQKDSVRMTIATRYPYQELWVRLPDGKENAFDLWAAYVPVDAEQRVNKSFGLLMIRKPSIPGLIHLMWPIIRRFTQAVFAQDRKAVEAEQRAHDEQGADWNHEVQPLIRELKALLTRRGVAPDRGSETPARRATPLGRVLNVAHRSRSEQPGPVARVESAEPPRA